MFISIVFEFLVILPILGSLKDLEFILFIKFLGCGWLELVIENSLFLVNTLSGNDIYELCISPCDSVGLMSKV